MKKKNKWLAVMLVTLLSYGMAWMLGSMWPVPPYPICRTEKQSV